jgi:MFS family permease
MLRCKRMEREATIARALFQREFLSVLIVVVNAFSWYFPLYLLFKSTLEKFQESLQLDPTFLFTAFGVQFAAIIGSAIIGTALVKRLSSRERLLSAWMFIGIFASILMITLETFSPPNIFIVSSLLGISLGLGFPSCLAYFGDHSTVENRGWLGGVTFCASGLCILFFGLVLSYSGLIAGAIILAVWRGVGLLLFILTRSKQDFHAEEKVEVSYKSILVDKSFYLHLIPWILFCLVNFLEAPVVEFHLGEDLASIIPIAEYGIGGFVALAGGWFADSVGRKRIVIVGFIMLGIGYASLGLLPDIAISWYLYTVMDGIAWGIFSLMFYLVIWSELAGNLNKEKYYLIGVSPFIIASYIQILFTPFAREVTNISAAFSLASFFLFIAVLPVLYAPETMPQKQIELKRLKKFAEDAKNAKEKYERKMRD